MPPIAMSSETGRGSGLCQSLQLGNTKYISVGASWTTRAAAGAAAHPAMSGALFALLCGTVLAASRPAAAAGDYDPNGMLELDTRSKYSHIRVRRTDHIRTLLFVRDSGEEVVETSLNLNRPHELLSAYTRTMFLSYLFVPKQERVLMVGLGGGAMVHFMKHYDPEVQVDVVEIDKTVVDIGRDYFGIRNEPKVAVKVADGIDYLNKTKARYDVVYMDAFLKPSPDTDSTGVPLRLKTTEFYKRMQTKLSAKGVVVFNLNDHEQVKEDVQNVRASFAQTYVFPSANSYNYVVIASNDADRVAAPTLGERGRRLDERFRTNFSFEQMALALSP